MKRILIVDDELTTRLELSEMLSSSGYHVVGEAETGREAIEMAQDLHPDLVLMDIVMPGDMDGISAAGKIKQESDIPIVFISGYGDPEYIERAKKLEPFGYVMKPFDETEIKAFIEIALYKSKIERKMEEAYRQLNGLNLSLKQEIEDRNRAEEALRNSEERYRNLVENLNDVIYSVNVDGMITYVSPPIKSLFGFTPAELVDKHFSYLVHPEDLDAIKEAFADILQGRFYPREYRMRTKGGNYRWVRTSSLPVFLDGKISGLQGVTTDITAYKQAEEALRSSEKKYRTILESIGDGYFEVDVAGNLTFCNDTFGRIVGYSEDELIGMNYQENKDKEAENKIYQVFNKVYTTGKPLKGVRHVFSRKDGQKVHIEVSVSLIKNSEGRKIGFRGIIRDVTEKIVAEKARLELEDQLHRAQKMAALGTLVAGVAHEINNPNNFITINAPMLNKAWGSLIPILEDYYDHNGDFMVGGIPYTTMRERVPQLLAGISDGSRRIKRIVSDLKHFARPDSSVSFEPLDINSAVKSSLTLVSNLIKKSTNNFKVEYGRNIPKIKGNLQHLEQVIINLVQNACQALSDKDKEIRVSTTYREKDETILIKIRDQGLGIPAESLPRIMDPFFTTRRSSGGTGLGLSVSFSIIEKHSGTLTATSEEGKGTTFTIALPVRGKKERVKVLVVDDDHVLRETIVESLEKNSMFSVEDSPNGMDACIKLGSFRPDLLILDIQMPDMNGVEVCKRIKGDPNFNHMKVMIITGFPGSDKAKKIAEMGFRNICPKPVKMKTFEEMVQRVLNGYENIP